MTTPEGFPGPDLPQSVPLGKHTKVPRTSYSDRQWLAAQVFQLAHGRPSLYERRMRQLERPGRHERNENDINTEAVNDA